MHDAASMKVRTKPAPEAQKQLQFRPPGSPAGSWKHTPWWHCTFYDPYESVNVWSHGAPAIVYLFVGICSLVHAFPIPWALTVYCFCTTVTQGMSAITHIYPDSHFLEKLDHLGIIAMIAGTPGSILIAVDHGADHPALQAATLVMLVVAFMPPLARTVGYIAGCATIVIMYATHIAYPGLGVELALFLIGAGLFLRNGGHNRGFALADHHIFHYLVTISSGVHVMLLLHLDATV